MSVLVVYLKLKLRIMKEIIERLESILKESGDTKNAFSIKVGINPSNFNRKMKGDIPFTSKDFAKISEALGIDRKWLETGNGEEPSLNTIRASKPSYTLEISPKLIAESIEKSVNDAINNPKSPFSVFANMFGDHNHQKISTGSDRAAEREELSYKEKNAQLIQIINAKDELIKAKDNEIRLLRKILADNNIEV